MNVSSLLNVASAHNARAFLAQGNALGAFNMHRQSDFFNVENNICHVFAHTGNRRKFMQHAIDLNRRHGSTLKRRQKNTAQRIAKRGAKAAFERFCNNSCDTTAITSRLNVELCRADKFLPVLLVHMHILVSRVFPKTSQTGHISVLGLFFGHCPKAEPDLIC